MDELWCPSCQQFHTQYEHSFFGFPRCVLCGGDMTEPDQVFAVDQFQMDTHSVPSTSFSDRDAYNAYNDKGEEGDQGDEGDADGDTGDDAGDAGDSGEGGQGGDAGSGDGGGE